MRDYGIDGFRVDTAKHVEMDAWQQLKTQATAALAEWKKANPDKALDAAPFWMTGEAWGHGVMQSDYYRHGFDAMINFDYQDQAAKAATCMANIDLTWQQMADKLQSFNVLSYLSSHDTRLFREGGTTAAELLLLAPGAVQIFYGDESSRPFGPTGSDPLQGTRSEMNWQDVNGKAARSVTHWQDVYKRQAARRVERMVGSLSQGALVYRHPCRDAGVSRHSDRHHQRDHRLAHQSGDVADRPKLPRCV